MFKKVTIKPRGRNLTQLNNANELSDPLCHALIYTRGEFGFRPGIKHSKSSKIGNYSNTSVREFYAYRFSPRAEDEKNHVFKCGKLFQQALVNSYVKIENNRLDFLRQPQQQKRFRSENQKGLMDFLNKRAVENDLQLGSLHILPSSFVGSERYMRQAYQDGMAMVAQFGKPDLFITFTSNPNWPDIQREINNQPYANRADICVRIFYQKLKELMKDLTERQIFGATIAHIRVIEFQKRGLPHAHILIWLSEEDSLTDPSQLDEIIWAEIPDPNRDKDLYEKVISHMRHKCDERCLENGKCKSYYPKPYSNTTVMVENGRTMYRRRNIRQVILPDKTILTNRNIVPYNPYLIKKYNCHVNVEWCSSVNAVKYLFKYIFKGYDLCHTIIQDQKSNIKTKYNQDQDDFRPVNNNLSYKNNSNTKITVRTPTRQELDLKNPKLRIEKDNFQNRIQNDKRLKIDKNCEQKNESNVAEQENANENKSKKKDKMNYDEISHYVDGRFLTSFEGFFRIYGYHLIKFSHTVIRLAVHLPDQQRILVAENASTQELQLAAISETTLTAWFKYNNENNALNDQLAPTLLYPEFPRFYRFINGKWVRRIQNLTERTLSRIYAVNPRNIELLCLRTLLLHRRGMLKNMIKTYIFSIIC